MCLIFHDNVFYFPIIFKYFIFTQKTCTTNQEKSCYSFSIESSIQDVINGTSIVLFGYGLSGAGKTYTLFYIDSYRTNPWFDEKGKELDPVFERTERQIHKRVRKGDLESFVKYNLTNVE